MYKEKSKIKKKQKEFFVKILKYKKRKEKNTLISEMKSSDQVEIKTRNKRMILNY